MRRSISKNADTHVVTEPLKKCRWCDVEIPTGQRGCLTCCTKCGTKCEPSANQCPNCKSFRPGNHSAQKLGVYSRRVPVDLRMTADELKDEIVSDLGGVDALSALEVSYVRKLADVEITLRMLTSDMAVAGVLTPGGRIRDIYPAYLAGVATFDRLAQRLGLKRRVRDLPTPVEWMRGEAE